MAEPRPLPTDDTENGEPTRPIDEPGPAPTDMEPPRPPASDTEAGDATHLTGELDRAQATAERSRLPSAAPKFEVQDIPIDDIVIVGPRRAVNEEVVTQLVRSIERIGLQTPITVRVQKNVRHPETGEVLASAYVLVVGEHRWEACRRLGWRTIPAIVRDCTRQEAEMWEVEENLARAELTPEEKTEQIIRLAAVIREVEETQQDSEFAKQRAGGPTTGRGHKGTIQKTAERIGVDQGTVRYRVKNAGATIDEPIDLARDSSGELRRKADKFRVTAAVPKAKPKTHRKEREKTQAAKPAHKDREKPQAMRAARQPDLAAVIRDLNVAWSPPAIETATATLTDDQKADLRQHLPDLISKLQWLADSIGSRSTDAAVDEASCADQPGLFGSN